MRVRTSCYSPGGPSAPQGRTIHSYVFHTTRDEHRLWNNLKKPGGPSTPKGRTVRRSSLKSTRDNNVSGTNCQIAGGPSAPQGRTVRRTDHKPNQRRTSSLVQFELELRTVRPPGPDCPPVTSNFHQSQTCSQVRVRTVRAPGSGLSALVQSALKLVLFQILSKRR